MQRGIERLRRRVEEVRAFDPSTVRERFGPEVSMLETSIADTLDKIFGHDTIERQRFDVGAFDRGPLIFSTFGRPAPDFHPYLVEGKTRSLAKLNSAIQALEEEIEEQSSVQPSASVPIERPTQTRKIFIVHGRADGPREAVARFLEKLGFSPIILHEQANQGRTVIEKIEAHSDVSFAVVLLTPDDHGSLKGEPLKARARQNVILELGYFIGRLSRKNVCTLVDGEIEIPSDWRGVVDEPLSGSWKQTLARELEAAGHSVDWNRVMRD